MYTIIPNWVAHGLLLSLSQKLVCWSMIELPNVFCCWLDWQMDKEKLFDKTTKKNNQKMDKEQQMAVNLSIYFSI